MYIFMYIYYILFKLYIVLCEIRTYIIQFAILNIYIVSCILHFRIFYIKYKVLLYFISIIYNKQLHNKGT